jgi:hypothetical protein
MSHPASPVLTATKPRKYDRDLAGRFIESRDGSALFLRNALLADGHAVLVGLGDVEDRD